ncbi:hypothetical protein K8R32_03540 [bacterium]|nr:hypothetical protein [bacterium]
MPLDNLALDLREAKTEPEPEKNAPEKEKISENKPLKPDLEPLVLEAKDDDAVLDLRERNLDNLRNKQTVEAGVHIEIDTPESIREKIALLKEKISEFDEAIVLVEYLDNDNFMSIVDEMNFVHQEIGVPHDKILINLQDKIEKQLLDFKFRFAKLAILKYKHESKDIKNNTGKYKQSLIKQEMQKILNVL